MAALAVTRHTFVRPGFTNAVATTLTNPNQEGLNFTNLLTYDDESIKHQNSLSVLE